MRTFRGKPTNGKQSISTGGDVSNPRWLILGAPRGLAFAKIKFSDSERHKMRKRKNDPHGIPVHLGADGREFYVVMIEEYGIEDAAGLALLARASECLDRIRQAQGAIDKHGVILLVNGKLTANPASKLEKESRDGFYAALRLLNVDCAPKAVGRPPRPVGASLETIEAFREGRWPRGVGFQRGPREWVPEGGVNLDARMIERVDDRLNGLALAAHEMRAGIFRARKHRRIDVCSLNAVSVRGSQSS